MIEEKCNNEQRESRKPVESYLMELCAQIPRGWRNVENVPTLTIFFSSNLPSPSYCRRCVCPGSDVLWNVFLSYGAGFSKILYLQRQPTYSPTYQLMNFQIIAIDALHASVWMEEHMWESTESRGFYKCSNYLQYYCYKKTSIVGIGAAKVSALDNRIFRQSMKLEVAFTNRSFHTATVITKCPTLITCSLKCSSMHPRHSCCKAASCNKQVSLN